MDAPQNFRSAFNGFNREDVVNYISYISTKHDTELNELRSEAEELREQLNAQEDAVFAADALREERDALQGQVEEANERVSQLQQEQEEKDAEIARLNEILARRDTELEQLRSELELSRAAHAVSGKEDRLGRWTEELNAYRRAESAERRARERVNQMYDQASGALAEASVRVEQTVSQISQLAAKVDADVAVLLKALAEGENTMADTAVMLGAIRPDMD